LTEKGKKKFKILLGFGYKWVPTCTYIQEPKMTPERRKTVFMLIVECSLVESGRLFMELGSSWRSKKKYKAILADPDSAKSLDPDL
jgi:hypothetical protein